MKFLAVSALLLLLAACNSVDRSAVDSFVAAGQASLQGSSSLKGSGLFPKKRAFWVLKIDGADVKQTGHFRAYPLAPGAHTIQAAGFLFRGHLGSHDVLTGTAGLNLDAKAAHRYELRGEFVGQQMSLYVFDLTTDVAVTPPAQVLAQAASQSDPIFIMIPLP